MSYILSSDGQSGVATREDTGQMQKQHFLYSQVPEWQGHEWASRGERHGSWLSQVVQELRESEDLRASEGQGRVLSKKCQRISSVCLDVTRYSQGRAGRWTSYHGRGQPYHTSVLGHLGGVKISFQSREIMKAGNGIKLSRNSREFSSKSIT